MKFFLSVVFLCLLSACSGRPPFLEYTLARTAIQSANHVKAKQNAKLQWMKAMNYYHKGEERFNGRHYRSARRFFNESMRWAEKAENISRLKLSVGSGL